MPNVKPGDLAIVRCAPHSNGNIVEIIDAAPDHPFVLPNGQRHARPVTVPSWIVKVVSGTIPSRYTNGVTHNVVYGVGADKYLFPLPGDTGNEQIDEATPVTVPAGDA
jgi:hypothetical protein